MKNKDVNPHENNTISRRYKVTKFYSGIHFNNILGKIGFINIENRPQALGATTIYVVNK